MVDLEVKDYIRYNGRKEGESKALGEVNIVNNRERENKGILLTFVF